MSSKRGLVVSPPMRISGTQLHLESSDLDPQELRANLLFWDTLDFPSNNAIHIGLSPDAEFLESAGILKRTRVQFSGSGDIAQIALNAHLSAFRYLDEHEPGEWSLATGERSISFPDPELIPKRGALVRLYNTVPVPDKDVPLADILEFREKHRDELLSFRHHLEDVYQKVVNAGDGPLAWNAEIDKLQAALADHIKAAKETPFQFRLSDISASLNLIPIGAAAIGAYAADLPMLDTILPAACGGIALNIGAALKNRQATATPFQYVSSFHRELF